MTPSAQAVCLCMIVKDEAPVIRRCLDSVRPLVDRWLIVDTGSTDGTQEIVREHYRDLRGVLVEQRCRGLRPHLHRGAGAPLAPYTLVIDADDTLERRQGRPSRPTVRPSATSRRDAAGRIAGPAFAALDTARRAAA